ncbi:DUF2946 family protein [Zwartia sp.]|uniref:DUF2946 family protein n=1 Tax=Zwartia sp. TaxID=2978004 RepID=UPI002725C2B4|nr:DUF2946 family protein [Zwartia sp.]MDO9024783.1 DUF2946 family protein [Zwartia sp.]
MDQSVLDAVKRWPDVPAVYGWLSLTARGAWRLHPLGDAQLGGPGQGITNTQILGFIGRNYTRQPDGAWYFQNGPQRVYVRLDAAPLIVHVDPSRHALTTHNGQTVQHVSAWYADETGQLYAQTDCGAARIDDRDLTALAEVLRSRDGRSLLEVLEAQTHTPSASVATLLDPQQHFLALQKPAELKWLASTDIPKTLRFVSNPGPSTPISPALALK